MVIRVAAPEGIVDRTPVSACARWIRNLTGGRGVQTEGPQSIGVTQSKGQPLSRWNPVCVGVGQKMNTSVTYVGQLQLRIACQFPLHSEVPLPGVGQQISRVLTKPWSAGGGDGVERWRSIERSRETSTQGKGWISCHLQRIV